MHIEIDGLSGPIAFVGCDDVARYMRRILRGWTIRESHGARPLMTVNRTLEGYDITMVGGGETIFYDDGLDTAGRVIVGLIQDYVAGDPSLLCLHGAAAAFAGRLVVFPSAYRAGKSLLTAYLASAGLPIFTDDILPLEAGAEHGVAPGILPRLRRPLPDDCDEEFLAYIETHTAERNADYLYLDGEAVAPLGETLPIGAFVLLNREDGADAALEPVKTSEMLKSVIWQNFARDVRSADLIERLHDLVGSVACHRLTYGQAGAASALLMDTFVDWGTPSPVAAAATATTSQAPARAGHLVRTAGITEREVDDEMFLIDGNGASIFHLNATSAALWSLLAEPTTRAEAAAALHEVFPAMPLEQIERDVGELLGFLDENGLIRES